MSFEPAKKKLSIGSLDDSGVSCEAQYNPKELQIEKPVPWGKHQMANKSGGQKDDGKIHLEFTGAESRTLTVELLFDGYEDNESVADDVGALETMASVIDPTSDDENQRRPHHCVVAWGDRGLPSFRCVIENLTTKYTMFDTNGTPLRATCTVKLKEADKLDIKSSS
jgi:hypothetical protein